MANLPIKNNPTLNLQMEALTTSTPAHADRFNERYQQLLEMTRHCRWMPKFMRMTKTERRSVWGWKMVIFIMFSFLRKKLMALENNGFRYMITGYVIK